MPVAVIGRSGRSPVNDMVLNASFGHPAASTQYESAIKPLGTTYCHEFVVAMPGNLLRVSARDLIRSRLEYKSTFEDSNNYDLQSLA